MSVDEGARIARLVDVRLRFRWIGTDRHVVGIARIARHRGPFRRRRTLRIARRARGAIARLSLGSYGLWAARPDLLPLVRDGRKCRSDGRDARATPIKQSNIWIWFDWNRSSLSG